VAAAYTTTGAPGETERRAGAALLAANPRLAGVAVVPKGTSVLVPSVTGLAPSARAEVPATVEGEHLDDVDARLKPAFDRLRNAVKRDADETAKTLKLVGSAAFKKLVQEEAATAAPARLAEAEKVLKERQKERERLLKILPALLDTARKDLAELKGREGTR
jgi:hypothetical protein